MNGMQILDFKGATVRTATEKDEPVFCLADVCRVLEIANPRNCVSRLSAKGVYTADTPTEGGMQSMTYISEQNLYKLIFQSRKPEAEAFADWVTGEVLPAIRRQGGYIAAAPEETPEQLYLRAMQSLKAAVDRQQKQIDAQRVQLQIQAPTVEYAETVLSSSSLLTVNTIAVHLGISAKALNLFLCGEDWIYRQGANWYPTAKIRGLGYCDYDTIPYVNSAGEQCTREHLKWTEQGRRAVIELWNKKHNVVEAAG